MEQGRNVAVASSSTHLDNGEQDENQGAFYRLNMLVSNIMSTIIRDDMYPFLIILLTVCFFASMTMIYGFYGSVNLPLGPNCSRLVQVNPLFVQSIKAREMDESSLQRSMLYGFDKPPPLDVDITWSETHNELVQSSYHKEWRYFLNEGSKVDISYNVQSPSSAPLSLVIAQGRESLVEWIEDPSYPNTTLSWNIIHGSGMIYQDILRSNAYFIALGNLNIEEVEVQLNFTIKASTYNTTQAYYNCSLLNHHECTLKLSHLRERFAILTSPGPEQGMTNYEWYVRLSYAPRWITYFFGSGVITIIIILALRICSMLPFSRRDEARYQAREIGSERAPLLSQKDDDLSSLGSSYDSMSHDEEELEKWLALDGKQLKDGQIINNPQRLCVICFDAPRDCFFLPCGHCAICFTCGTRIIEEAGTCPICRRTMKKVRKIFTV